MRKMVVVWGRSFLQKPIEPGHPSVSLCSSLSLIASFSEVYIYNSPRPHRSICYISPCAVWGPMWECPRVIGPSHFAQMTRAIHGASEEGGSVSSQPTAQKGRQRGRGRQLQLQGLSGHGSTEPPLTRPALLAALGALLLPEVRAAPHSGRESLAATGQRSPHPKNHVFRMDLSPFLQTGSPVRTPSLLETLASILLACAISI